MENLKTKVLIHQYTDEINKMISDVTEVLPYVQSIVKEFNKLGLGGILDYNELFNLYHNAEEFWKSKAYANIKVPEIDGPFEIDKEAYIKGQGIKFKESTNLLAAVAELRRISPYKHSSIEFYTVKGGKAIINEEYLQDFINGKKTFAESDAEIELVDALDELSKAMNKVNQVYRKATGLSAFFHDYSGNSHHRKLKSNFVSVEQEMASANSYGYGVAGFSPSYDLVVEMKKQVALSAELNS